MEQGACQTMMAAINLKSRAGASCLAIVAKTNKATGANLLDGFAVAAKSANDSQRSLENKYRTDTT